MKMTYLVVTLFAATVLWVVQFAMAGPELTGQLSDLPKGYYVFAKAGPNVRPPKVRKPPYLPISAECQGIHDINSLIPKNNLCGDLNRGFIPRNPMGQYLSGQPYPFDVIKNKTLQFLSKTLPYLRDEIDNVPKVARFVKPAEFFESLNRHRREAVSSSNLSEGISTEVGNGTVWSSQVTPLEMKENNSTKMYRQNNCEGNAVCQALESLKQDGPFSKSFLSNVVSAVGNVASINSVVTLLDQYSQLVQNPSTSNGSVADSNNKFGISQLLSSVTSMGDSGATSNVMHANGPSSGNYSPIMSIIDYLQSLQTPKYATKRKTPSEPDDYFPEGPEKPQTPCTSTEEYISPTYARNFQGVWKYVVQIPNEGYFTQTIQQTTCLKSKCDLIEGSCRESPRWVSLLVAEIFYPDVYFPMNQIMPMIYKQQVFNNNLQPQQPTPQQQKGTGKRPNQAPLNPNQLTNLDLNMLANLLKQPEIYNQQAMQNMELLSRRARTVPEQGPAHSGSEASSDSVSDNDKKHCDGYDKIGCYVVRVYFDWFLVNGSCKCWKSSHSTINDTIKRIFIGKWKKK